MIWDRDFVLEESLMLYGVRCGAKLNKRHLYVKRQGHNTRGSEKKRRERSTAAHIHQGISTAS